MQETQRIPLSLEIPENNLMDGNYSSSSCSKEYRYSCFANNFADLPGRAKNTFHSSATGPRTLVKWTVISACTLFTGLASTRFSGRSKYVVGIISVVFFFVICRPKLSKVAQWERVAQEAEDKIYINAQSLINILEQNCTVINLIEILPKGTFLNQIKNDEVNPDLEITQGLLEKLDAFIDTLRMLHQWNSLRTVWTQGNRPQRQFDGTYAAERRFLVDWVLVENRYPLAQIIDKIEHTRQLIANTLNPQKPEHQDRVVMTQACRLALGELVTTMHQLIKNVDIKNITFSAVSNNYKNPYTL